MALQSPPSSTTLSDLPDDCIRLIINEVAALRRENYNKPKSIKSLSLVNKWLRQLCLPKIFKSDKLRLWSDAKAETFQALSNAPHVTLSLLPFKMEFGEGPQSAKASTFYDDFVNAVASMTNLSELHVSFNNNIDVVSKFRTAFMNSGATFPTIKTLELIQAPNAAFIIKACPSLKTFIAFQINKSWKSTFAALPSMTTLQHFEIDAFENWTPRRLEAILPYVKNIPELCIKGDLYRVKLSSFAPCFSSLENLTALSMTSSQWVNESYFKKFYADDGLLNAIDDDRHYNPLNENTEQVARAFFTACPSLVSFRGLFFFDGLKYLSERSDGGKVIKIQIDEEDNNRDGGWFGFLNKFHIFDQFPCMSVEQV